MPFAFGLLLDRSGLMRPPEDFIAAAILRPQPEIDRARSIAETWHWRTRTAQLVRAGRTPPQGFSAEKIVEVTAGAAHDRGFIPSPVDGDFPAFGKAYRLLSNEELGLKSSIAQERHYALNWVCGYAPDWDHTRTDT